MEEVSYIEKGDKTVNGQYRFASHDQVTAKLHPLLVKWGIVVIPTVSQYKQDGNRTEVVLVTSFQNIDDPADKFEVTSIGYGIDSVRSKETKIESCGDKGPGKAISYAFKYACLKTFCLETGDDPDQDANAYHEPEKCQEFDLAIPADVDRKLLDKYLVYCAEVSNGHPETVKREAVKRLDAFLVAYEKWRKKTQRGETNE